MLIISNDVHLLLIKNNLTYRCVDMVITEMGVFEQRDGQMVLTEIDEDVSLDAVRAATGFNVKVADDLSAMKQQQ